MAPDEEYTPDTAPAEEPQAWLAAEPIATAKTPAAFELRPLALGEILDRTFSIYRSRFWLFAGIASISAAILTIMQGLQLFVMHFGRGFPTPGTAPQAFPFGAADVGAIVLLVVFWLLFLLVFCVTQAASAFALGEVYLGHPMTVGGALKAIRGRWYRYIGIAIWQFCSFLWMPVAVLVAMGVVAALTKSVGLTVVFVLLVIAAFVVGFILMLRNLLAVPACVIEALPVRAAMRRSKDLAAGKKGRIFVVLLLSIALRYAMSFVQMPLMFFMIFAAAKGHQAIWAQALLLVVIFVGYTLVEPVLMLGLSLVYFDQRVRNEALDLVMMMGPEVPVVGAAEIFTTEVAAAPEEPRVPAADGGEPVE